MAYPYARVGSVTNKGDHIITGAATAFVDPPSGGGGVSVTFNGKVLVFPPEDEEQTNQDDPEGTAASSSKVNPELPASATTPSGPPGSGPAGTASNPVTDVNNSSIPTPTDCQQITGQVPYTFKLSNSFVLSALSTAAVYHNNIVAQHGLTVAQIVCNLKALAMNPLETLAVKYGRGNLLITSGFRPSKGTSPNSAGTPSQHELGQAADVQIPHLSNDDFWAAALWVKDNVPFDQFILEIAGSTSKGHRPWMHLSFNRQRQRKKVNTWLGGSHYASGLIRTF